jgi:hypothetical protein
MPDGGQSQQHETPNIDAKIDELKSEHTTTSVANLKDTQAKGTTTVKPSRKKQKPNQNGAYIQLVQEPVWSLFDELEEVVDITVVQSPRPTMMETL